MPVCPCSIWFKIYIQKYLCACVPPVKIEQSVETLDIFKHDALKGKENNAGEENESIHGRHILYNSQCAQGQHCWKGIAHSIDKLK